MATTNGIHANGDSTKTSPRPTVCVFCGASPGTSPAHLAAARDLAQQLHKAGLNLVYGGGTAGIMGEVAKTLVSLSGPGSVHGIIPKALLRYERSYVEDAGGEGKEVDPRKTIDEETFGRTTVVPDMHTRKRMMAEEVRDGGYGGGFVALTGGYGTLEELMEMVTWNQLGIHASPVVLFNVEGYWGPILQWVKGAVESGMIGEGNRDIMVEAKTAEEVIKRLGDYRNAEGRFKLKWDEQ
ncbi:hypothetical protein LTS10_000116 [Elasticomyces elasticus]|nr:hypothetical protein LTS10_000116 [Elasticomyces elasticus]